MKYRVKISHQADADLRGIFEYITYTLRSLQNAVGQLERLEAAILSLDSMPERYRKYENGKWQGRNLRVMPIDKYLVFYIPDREQQIVEVVRVLYGGMEVDKHLDR